MCRKEEKEKGENFRIYQEFLTLKKDENGAVTGGSFHYPEKSSILIQKRLLMMQ